MDLKGRTTLVLQVSFKTKWLDNNNIINKTIKCSCNNHSRDNNKISNANCIAVKPVKMGHKLVLKYNSISPQILITPKHKELSSPIKIMKGIILWVVVVSSSKMQLVFNKLVSSPTKCNKIKCNLDKTWPMLQYQKRQVLRFRINLVLNHLFIKDKCLKEFNNPHNLQPLQVVIRHQGLLILINQIKGIIMRFLMVTSVALIRMDQSQEWVAAILDYLDKWDKECKNSYNLQINLWCKINLHKITIKWMIKTETLRCLDSKSGQGHCNNNLSFKMMWMT